MEHFSHTNTYHLKVSNTFSKFNHTVNQNTKSLTLTTTSFLKETCLCDTDQSLGPLDPWEKYIYIYIYVYIFQLYDVIEWFSNAL